MGAIEKYEARITVPSTYTMSVTDPGGTSVISLAAGDYYLTSVTSLLVALATALNADATLSGTYALSVDDNANTSTGKITLSANVTFAVTWVTTALRDALGFTGNLSAGASYLSTNASPFLWLPDVRRANPLAPIGSGGMPVTDGTSTMSPTGVTRVMRFALRYVETMEYRFLSGRKTWRKFESTPNESLQSFFESCLSLGLPLRFHPDRSDDATFEGWRNMAAHDLLVKTEFEGFVGNATTADATNGSVTRWRYGPADLARFT